jgi:hypothetical protein
MFFVWLGALPVVAQDAGVAAAPPPVATAPVGPPAPSAEAFDARVKTIEEKVSDLKEKIYRTKARLLLLQEAVLGGDPNSGARAVIFHRNEMGSSFLLESVSYSLDGAPIFTQLDVEGDLDRREEFEIFNGRIVPGQHQIAVRLIFRGHGFGVFSYLEGYKFKVQSSYTFNAEPGKVTQVKAVAFEKGGLTADLKDRPAVRFDIQVNKDLGGRQSASSQTGEAGKKP